jgi:SAM-dependent methyltransferase
MEIRSIEAYNPALVHDQYAAGDQLIKQRLALWAYRVPAVDIVMWCLGQVKRAGTELVVDVGCGNGRYLNAVRDEGHRGHLIAIDLSFGMLQSIHPSITRLNSDITSLPLLGGVADITLAMHMLQHVRDKRRAISELHRITRRGGTVLVAGYGRSNFSELKQLTVDSARAVGVELPPIVESFTLESGAELLAEQFSYVERIDLEGRVEVPDVEVVLGYVGSQSRLRRGVTPEQRQEVLAEMRRQAASIIDRDGVFRITPSTGCFRCR